MLSLVASRLPSRLAPLRCLSTNIHWDPRSTLSPEKQELRKDRFDTPRPVIPLPDRLRVDVSAMDQPSAPVGSLWLDASVFGHDPIRIDLLHRAVEYYRAKKRGMRTAVTKTIAQVSGSGRKLRPQKGQGKARVGHSRPPHFRGGAKAHGPKNVTDYGNTKLNKKVRQLALKHALSQKLKEQNLLVWNPIELESHKTKELAQLLDQWQIRSALILDAVEGEDTVHGLPVNLHVAAANLPNIRVANHFYASVYEILKYEKLVLTLPALELIEGRLKKA